MELSSLKIIRFRLFQEETLKSQTKKLSYFFKEFLKTSLYSLYHNILHQNYYNKFLCFQ